MDDMFYGVSDASNDTLVGKYADEACILTYKQN